MEAESFTNDEVAAALKKDYIAIKVDREERPDIDQFYMQVGIELSGSGGWPLTIIMTPEKIPIFAGTYFPPKQRFNRPGLIEILPQIAAAWQKDPAALLQGGKAVINVLQQRQNNSSPGKNLTVAQFQQAEASLQQNLNQSTVDLVKRRSSLALISSAFSCRDTTALTTRNCYRWLKKLCSLCVRGVFMTKLALVFTVIQPIMNG